MSRRKPTPSVEPIEAPDTPSDEEVQAAIDAAIAENQAKYAEANAGRRVSVTDLYDQFTELVLKHTRGGRNFTNQFRTEQSAIRVLELTLMWALNNRQDVGPSIPVEELNGTTDELVGPEPDEIIEGSTTPEPTTEEAA